jgi:predicted XRE-type DNA-binding protein
MDDTKVTEGSGNVFADLGLPDAGELLVKADLAIEIGRVIDPRGLPQSEAVRILRTSQPRISDLRRGKLEGFTIDRLLRFLNALD